MQRTLLASLVTGTLIALCVWQQIGQAAGYSRGRPRRSGPAVRGLADLASAVTEIGSATADLEFQLARDAWRVSRENISEHFELIDDVGHEAARSFADSLAKAEVNPAPIGPPPLPPQLEALSGKIHDVLAIYSEKHLNTAQHSPWEIMHRMVAFGIPTEIRRDAPDGQRVNAIGWLLWGGRGNGQPLLVLTAGKPTGRVGPGVQGHPGQFLGMLAQSEVSAESPFKLEGKSFTVADLIEQEKLDCTTNEELTFKLIAFSYYLKSDESWLSQDNQKWSISRLLQEEIRQPIRTAACGGTHRLFGISSAYMFRAKQGKPIDGEFQRAQTYIRDYQRYTLGTLQNPDGSFSTDWFNKPANAADQARKLQTTGHMLEWLVWSLPDEQLRDPRVIKAIDFIATTLAEQPNHDWAVGPLGHALHALAIYDKRIHGLRGSKPEQFARRKAIYTSMLPNDLPAAPSAGDSTGEGRFDVLPAHESEHYLPRRLSDTPADECGSPLLR